ncbi:MAG TPA: hypothetical protein VF299_10470 [Mycobacterium sp.]
MLDLEPQGPLPSQIYWRRRGLALGVGVVVVGAVLATVIALVHGGSAEADSVSAKKPVAEQPAKPPAPPQEEVKSPVIAPEAQPNAPATAAAVVPPPVLQEGDDCPDSTLAVKGITSEPRYTLGDQPKFTMVVTNIGLVSCKRDVGAAVLAAYMYSLDNQRLWSNLDCAPSNETLVKTFAPGEQVTTEVTWTGMGSAPQCPLPRQPIGAGTYNLVVQLGNLRSSTVPFMLTEPSQPDAPAPIDGAPPVDAPPPGN